MCALSAVHTRRSADRSVSPAAVIAARDSDYDFSRPFFAANSTGRNSIPMPPRMLHDSHVLVRSTARTFVALAQLDGAALSVPNVGTIPVGATSKTIRELRTKIIVIKPGHLPPTRDVEFAIIWDNTRKRRFCQPHSKCAARTLRVRPNHIVSSTRVTSPDSPTRV